jgi:hypothetical protein
MRVLLEDRELELVEERELGVAGKRVERLRFGFVLEERVEPVECADAPELLPRDELEDARGVAVVRPDGHVLGLPGVAAEFDPGRFGATDAERSGVSERVPEFMSRSERDSPRGRVTLRVTLRLTLGWAAPRLGTRRSVLVWGEARDAERDAGGWVPAGRALPAVGRG